MLVTALKDSRWFIPLERQGLQNLLNERKIIRAAQENGTVADNNRMPLQSLAAANVMIEGSIIGYESNVKSGGAGARYFGIGADTQYQLDQIAVNLRVVNVSTGEVLFGNHQQNHTLMKCRPGCSASLTISVCWRVKSVIPLTSR